MIVCPVTIVYCKEVRMAVALAGDGARFEKWLSSKLKAFHTDDSVLIPYVKGILESEEEDDAEKRDALVGILAEISVSLKKLGMKNATTFKRLHLLILLTQKNIRQPSLA